MASVGLKRGLESVMEASGCCNRYFQTQQPWELLKSAPETLPRCRIVTGVLFRAAHLVLGMAEPFMPQLAVRGDAPLWTDFWTGHICHWNCQFWSIFRLARILQSQGGSDAHNGMRMGIVD
jgi:hypothetical protein